MNKGEQILIQQHSWMFPLQLQILHMEIKETGEVKEVHLMALITITMVEEMEAIEEEAEEEMEADLAQRSFANYVEKLDF